MRVLAVSTGVGAAVLAVDLTLAPAFASPTAPVVHHRVPHVTAQPAPMLPPPPQTPILLAVPPSTAAPHIPLVPGADDIPSVVLTAYERAAQAERTLNPGCRLPWQLIAAIGYIESGNGQIGGDTVTAQGEERSAIEGIPLDGSNGIALITDGRGGFARAEGPMQFIPSTWTTWGADGNGDGHKDVQNVFDATLAAAQYLCADSYDLGAPPNQPAAIMRYNHSPIYVKNVMNVEAAYAAGLSAATVKLIPMPGPKCPPGPPGKPHKHRPGCGRPHHAKAHRAPAAEPTLTVVAARSGSSTTPSPKPSPSPTPTTVVATPTPTPTPSASPTPTASPTP